MKRLYRTDGPISGVAAGMAAYFNVDVSLIRLGLVAGTLLGGPVVPIGYVAAWLIIPQAEQAPVAPIMAPATTTAPAPAPAPGPVDTVDTVDTVEPIPADSSADAA